MRLPRGRREAFVALAVAAAVFALVAPRLLLEPILGMANNGDFERLMCPTGLAYPEDLSWSDKYFSWVQRSFRLVPPPAHCMRYVTSERLFVEAAILLGGLVAGGCCAFDLRLMGLVHTSALASVFVCILFATRRFCLSSRALLFCMLAIVFADLGYVAYFNSFYCEPASLLFFLATAGAFLVAASLPEPGAPQSRRALAASLCSIAGFHVSALLFVGSKPQNYAMSAPLLLPAAFLLLGERRLVVRILAITGLVSLPLASLLLFRSLDPAFARAQLFDIVFLDVVGHSPHAERDLERLGLGQEFRKYLGTSAWQDRSVLDDPEFRRHFDRVTHFSVMQLYLTDPRLLLDDLRRTAEGALDVRLAGKCGMLERAAGAPARAQPSSFAAWSIFREATFPRTAGFLLGFGALNLAAVAIKWSRFDRSRFDRGASLLHLWVVATGAVAFVSVTMGGGSFDSRHLFLFDATFDACCVILASYALGLVAPRWFVSGETPRP